jgi:predicted AlkP superfamily pyrophosphatase or phosphodiesterase
MMIIRRLICSIFCFVLFGTGSILYAQVKHVILISIDGLHNDMYLDATWPVPNLRGLMKEGTYANHCLGGFPSYTYPSHTAMITGAYPARSGIYFNQPISSRGDWFWFVNAVKVPTLWQVLKAKGLTTAAVQWPVSVGGTKINDLPKLDRKDDITWNMPEIWDNNHPDDRITETRHYATKGLVEEVEENATGKLDSTNFNDNYFSLDENAGRVAAYVFQAKKPVFMVVNFACVDGQEHEFGRDADSVRLALASVDRAIGEILEAVEKSKERANTTIIVTGDHGFANINQIMRPNMLLSRIPARFIAAGGSAFLYSQVKAIEPGDPAAQKRVNEEIVKAVTDSLNQLPKDKLKLFRIIDRNELDRMGADSNALMALAATPGLVFSGSSKPKQTENHGPGTLVQNNKLEGLFIPTTGGHHGYDPNIPEMYTGFIAAGAGIKKGGHIKEMKLVDIAPLIAKLLNIEFKSPDGKLKPGILKQN